MSVTLLTSAHPAAALDAVFLPWLKNAAAGAQRARLQRIRMAPKRHEHGHGPALPLRPGGHVFQPRQ